MYVCARGVSGCIRLLLTTAAYNGNNAPSLICRGKINFVSTFQTAPAQENPSTGKTLKNMQLVLTACRREEKKLFFVAFSIQMGTLFRFYCSIAHTSFLFVYFLFLVFFSLLTIGFATAHNAQCGCVVYCYNL